MNLILPRVRSLVTGYRFEKWYQESALTNVYAGDTDLTTVDGDIVTVFAKWEEGNDVFYIYFNPGNGNGSMSPQAVQAGAQVTLQANTFKKTGYGFYRWASNIGEYYKNKAVISSLNQDLYLTAEWRKSSGGGGNGGGGGGGGGGLQDDLKNNIAAPSSVEIQTTKAVTAQFDSTQTTWTTDTTTGKQKLTVSLNGQNVSAVNGFYVLIAVSIQKINNVDTAIPVANTYYFDQTGAMYTGWLKTADNKTYFFENAKNVDEGKMVTGWKQIQNDWYYFSLDGSMLINGMTPDGYQVGVDGKMKK